MRECWVSLLRAKHAKLTIMVLLLSIVPSYNLFAEFVRRWSNAHRDQITYSLKKNISFKKKKNVYFILLDSYTSIEGLKLLDINESSFLGRLYQRGFYNYESFFNNFQAVYEYMPSYLHMDIRNDLEVLYDVPRRLRSKITVSESQVHKVFLRNGYRYNHINFSSNLIKGDPSCLIDRCDVSSNRYTEMDGAF